METQTNSATEILLTEMEQDIHRLKQLSVEYHQIPLSLANSPTHERLHDRFEQESARFYLAYGQDKSFRLEALNPTLFLEFNQYLIDHVCGIDGIYQAPTFMEYLLIGKP